MQMAFGSTSVTLSDKNRFPMFARSCPSDFEQANILVELLHYLDLKKVAVVSVSDDTTSTSMASIFIDS
jgi:ABC-type branched-subunit amino acid transport system substrate-binding protein